MIKQPGEKYQILLKKLNQWDSKMFVLCRDSNTQDKISEVISEFRDEFIVKSGGYSLPTISFDSIYRNDQQEMQAVLP